MFFEENVRQVEASGQHAEMVRRAEQVQLRSQLGGQLCSQHLPDVAGNGNVETSWRKVRARANVEALQRFFSLQCQMLGCFLRRNYSVSRIGYRQLLRLLASSRAEKA